MNPQMLEDVYNASQRSQGSAQRELDTYLDSIEAKFAKLQNRLQELAYTSVSSDFIKDIVDGLTKAVELATKLVDVIGVLPTILGAGGGFILQKLGLGVDSFFKTDVNTGKSQFLTNISKIIDNKTIAKLLGNTDAVNQFTNTISGVFSDFDDQTVIDKNFIGKLGGFDKLPTAIQEYIQRCNEAGEATITLGGALRALSTQGLSVGNIISVIGKGLLQNVGVIFATQVAVALLTKAFQVVATGIDNFIHRDEIMIQKGKEATEAITERAQAFKDYQDQLSKIESETTGEKASRTSEKSIKKIAEEYDKLHKKVNAGTNENEGLQTDEYQRYLELSNQIAEQSPALVKGWDAQGNAILNLGSSADEAEAALMRMYEAERRAANVEIAGNLQASYDGFAKQIEQKETELKGLQNKLDGLKSKQVQNEETPGGISSLDDLDFNSNIIQTSSVEAENNLRKAFNSVNQSYGLILSKITSDINSLNQTFQVQGFEQLTPDQQSSFRESLKTALQSGIESQGVQLAEEITNQMGQINAAELFIQDQKKNITSTIGDYLSTSDIFAKQSAAFQDAFLANIGNLDISKLMGDTYSGDIMSFMYGEIIEPLYKLQPEAQAAIDGLFKLDPEKTSVWKYIDTVQKQLTDAFGGDEKLAGEWRQKLGFDQIIQDITDAQLDISNEFKDQSGKILEDSGFDPSVLAQQTLSDLKLYADLVRTHSYETWEQLQEDFKKQKERVYKTDKTRTLADVLSDETFKSDVDYANYEGNLSSLTSALETLRTEGSLTAETLVSLQKSMPSLTDFSEDSLKDTAFKQLDAWIQRIREEMTTMSEEGKEQTRTMIANMVNQYGDLDLVASDVANAYVKERGHIGQEAAVDRAEYDRKVKELQESLGDEELDYHVLYTLVASDQFSGTAEEILDKYRDAEIQWHLIIDNKELEEEIQKNQQLISNESSERSLKEAQGQTLTPRDYSESLLYATRIRNARNQEVANTLAERNKQAIGTDSWDTWNISYLNAQAAAMDAETEVAQLQKEQIDASLNGLRNAVTDADNEVTKAQNAITKAEENVGEGMADQKLYDTLAAALLLRSLANTNLSDAQQKLYNTYKDTNKEWAQGWLSDSLSSASSAQNDSKEANAQRNIQYQRNLNLLQEDATRIQRELTTAERDHQHTSQMTYRDLIDNGRAQIENLRAQQDMVKDDISSWRNYQDQIEQMEDSIYDWSATMEQALSTSTADQMSTGFVTEEQLNALKSAGVDYSDMLEVGAKGWKLNTDKVNEYEDALRAVQVAQSKQIESDAKDRMAAIDKEMKALLGESSDQAKMAEEAGKNAANNFVSGMSEGLGTARQGGLQALDNLEAGIDKADISERIKAGIDAQGLLDEGYFQDLAEAQSYLDLSGAREELEATIQAQQEYQIATAASIDIAKQFSEASSAANDRDLAETVSGGVKGAIETKNKGWWGDKNLQQYAKFFAPEDMPLYQALDELEKSWNETWSKYYGSDGELTDEGVQQFFKDAGIEFGSQVVHDEKYGDYTQDWLIGDIDINKLAADYNTSKENIISLLSAFEDTRSWQQVDWSSIFGNSQDISDSTDAMAEYLNNLELLHKYNPDMDMSEYLQTAVSGFSGLTGEDPLQVQALVDQLNQLAELTGQNYKINITDGGNIEVIDTKLERMHELVDSLKLTKNTVTGEVTADDTETLSTLNELAEFANGEGKEIMLEWGFKPAENGEFTPESLADQVIEFDWTLKEHPTEEPGEGGYTIGTPSIATIDSGIDSVVNVLGEIAGYVATIAGVDRDNTNGEDESSESENSEDYDFINPDDPFYGKPTLTPNEEFFETHRPVAENEVENATINVTNGEVNTEETQNETDNEANTPKDNSDRPDRHGASTTKEYRDQLVSEGEESRLHEVHGATRDPSLYSSTDYDFVGAHENGANPIAQIWDSLFGGSKESEQVETAVINATTAEVNSDTVPNDDTNTPGTLSKGESLTSEQRSEYSSTSETPEGEAYEPESQTSTAVINADVAELNANLPNETDPNYQPPSDDFNYRFINPSNPFTYGQAPQPAPGQSLPMNQGLQLQTIEGTTTPGELSASEVSVSGGSVTVSGPVEMPTSTPTETSTFTPTPTVTSSPAPEAPTTEATTKVTVEADVTPAEEAIAGLEDKTVTIGVQIETPQPEEFQGVLDRVSNSKPQSVQVDASVQDGATEGLQEVENKANEVDALNPTVTAQTQDNASSVLNSVISTSQEVDAQAPNVGVEATDNASSTLGKVKGLADDVESTDPNVSVSASTGNTISVLTNILNTVNQLPPSRIINITTKYNTIGSPPGQASGTFHPAQNLGTVKSAFADGTVGKLWNDYSRQNSLGAYSRGTDVTLSRNQDALVNEVGIESIVFYVRTCTVMCMQLFIKLRGHPKANQATT